MKIAVLRANALGDFIFGIPALQALRHHFPQAEIIYLGCPWHQEFLKHRPSPIDRVIIVPPSQGVRVDGTPNQTELKKFFYALQQEHFDLAFQLHGGGKYSNPFIKQIGAKHTIGLQNTDASPLDISIPYVFYQSEYLRYLEVVNAVGAKPVSLMPHLSVIDADRLVMKTPYCVVHPGVSDPRRRWPTDRFVKVSEWCINQGYTVCVTGTESESSLAATFSDSVVNLCGKLTLSQLTGLLSQAKFVVANDTGPYHLAVAVDTPAVGIYWCGNLINSAPLFKTKHRALASWQIHCPVCGMEIASPGFPFTQFRSTCQHQVSFVESIQVDEVIDEIKNLLNTVPN